jgi:threonine/homoserine/homoserine lactone efflux protein
VNTEAGLWAAFGFGFALGAAPGPVQLLILSQTARRGLAGGLRVMLGANLTMLVILLALALGLSALEPSPTGLRILRVIGGVALVILASLELQSLRAAEPAYEGGQNDDRWGPTAIGVLAVFLNPGAWLFFATTASSILATTAVRDGRVAAIAIAFAIAIGVSCSDLLFSVLGSGGRRVIGDRGLRWVRTILACALGLLGLLFVAQGVRG